MIGCDRGESVDLPLVVFLQLRSDGLTGLPNCRIVNRRTASHISKFGMHDLKGTLGTSSYSKVEIVSDG